MEFLLFYGSRSPSGGEKNGKTTKKSHEVMRKLRQFGGNFLLDKMSEKEYIM